MTRSRAEAGTPRRGLLDCTGAVDRPAICLAPVLVRDDRPDVCLDRLGPKQLSAVEVARYPPPESGASCTANMRRTEYDVLSSPSLTRQIRNARCIACRLGRGMQRDRARHPCAAPRWAVPHRSPSWTPRSGQRAALPQGPSNGWSDIKAQPAGRVETSESTWSSQRFFGLVPRRLGAATYVRVLPEMIVFEAASPHPRQVPRAGRLWPAARFSFSNKSTAL